MKPLGVVLWLLLSATAAAEAPEPAQGAVAGPRIAVEPPSFDFGRTFQQRTLEKEFRLRNLGSGELAIENVSTTCGCTVAEGYAKTVKPGASTTLRVKLETRDSRGRLERKVLIRSNDKRTPLLEVKVAATVTAP